MTCETSLTWLSGRWQRWLFRHGDLKALAVCRMTWALAMLLAVWHESSLARLYSHSQYHVPLLPLAVPLDAAAFHGVMAAAALGGCLTLVGLCTRVGISITVASLGYVFALDLLLFRNHIYLGLLMGGLLALSPSGQALSLDAAISRWRGRPFPRSGSLAGAQLLKVQVLIVYGYSALNKLQRPFLDGYVLERELPLALRGAPLGAWLRAPTVQALLDRPTLLAALSCAVVLAEAFLVVGLPSRRLRPYAVSVGVALHACIFLLMGIHVFGLLMLSTYLLFFDRGHRAVAAIASVGVGKLATPPERRNQL